MDQIANIDRRVIRTKIAIREAFISLIEEIGFDALSVTDITHKADINRGTFYLHYRDKFDLLEKTETEVIHDMLKIILHANYLNLSDFNSIDRPLPIIVTLFEYLKDHASLMRALLGVKGDVAILNVIRKTIENNIKIGFLDVLKSVNFMVPDQYLITYIVSAHLGVLQLWLKNGCVESPKEMALILSKISLDGPVRSAGISL